MHARERLYLTAGRDRLVGHNDPKAAFLYAAEGDEIPASAADKFGLVDGKLKPGKADRRETLLGSSVLPAMVELTSEISVQLGDVVAFAHQASGLTVEAWNELPDAEREGLLEKAIETMRADPPAPKPTKPKAPTKAKAAGKEQKPGEDKEQKPGENKGQ